MFYAPNEHIGRHSFAVYINSEGSVRDFLLATGAAASLLTGCSTEPPQIPADINDAGQFCMAAKMLSMRDADGRERGDKSTVSAAIQQQAYPMIAASKLDDFATFLAEGDLVNSEQVYNYGIEFEPSEFDLLVSQCDAHFGISGELAIPTLPQDDFDAIYSCHAASNFVDAMTSQSLFDNEGKGPHFRQILQRMTTQMEFAVAQRCGISDAEGAARVTEGLRHAFSQGNMMDYLAACDAEYRDKWPKELG